MSNSQTQAMIISTQHLFTSRNLAALENAAAQSESHDAPASGQRTPLVTAVAEKAGDVLSEAPAPSKSVETSASDTPNEGEATSKAPTPPLPSSTVGADEAAPETAAASPGTAEGVGTVPGGFNLDIAFEASKLPMDVAIFNSARAAGGDEKIRKYLQAVLVVGGTALIPGISHALESRCALAASVMWCAWAIRLLTPRPTDYRPLRRHWCQIWIRCRSSPHPKVLIRASLCGRARQCLGKWMASQTSG
jgi:actin-related protein 8